MEETTLKVFKRFDERLTALEEGQSLILETLTKYADNIKNTKFTCVYCGKRFKDIMKHYKKFHNK